MKFVVYLALNLVVHVILFISVFDIYFTSPIIHGARDFQQEASAPASRLVLFVADGLRADTFFSVKDEESPQNPFLRDIILNHGSWGISRTKPPTESRPCHVAMTSGFYEDVTAIFKAWKTNPVEFDNVFNKSRHTWAFGSHEVIPIFSRGDTLSHYETHIYHGDKSDAWVFDKFSSFFAKADAGSDLYEKLHQNKIVFFLHLVATDTFGHIFGGDSKAYTANVKKVDNGISHVVKLLDDFYDSDGRTAYVFVSDHGMTDRGSHGAGSREETESPLVVWGSGAAKHKMESTLTDKEKERAKSWKLNSDNRLDVNQVDLAPLMSALIGVPVPTSSVGVLPVHHLSVNKESKARLMLNNAKQSCELLRIKAQLAREQSLVVIPFLKLTDGQTVASLHHISQLIDAQKYDDAIESSLELIQTAHQGSRYYHTYHRFSLCLAVLLSYVGWMSVTALVIIQSEDASPRQSIFEAVRSKKKSMFSLAAITVVLITLFSFLSISITSYLYYLLPLYIWSYIIKERHIVQSALPSIFDISCREKLIYGCVVLAIPFCVVSFYERSCLSSFLGILALSGFHTNVTKQLKVIWFVACAIACIFPLLPVVSSHTNPAFVVIAAILASIFAIVTQTSRRSVFFSLLPFLSGIAVYVIRKYSSSNHVAFLVIFDWVIFVLSWILPLLTSSSLSNRVLTLFACHTAVYLLLSLTYDAIFFVSFSWMLAAWVRFEMDSEKDLIQLSEMNQARLTSDARYSVNVLWRSFMLVFFLVFALFAISNTVSIDHFDKHVLSRPFTASRASDYLQTFLLFTKIALPYLVITYASVIVAKQTRTRWENMFCCAQIIFDVIAICFLFLVADDGSWLDVGTSVAHYAISTSLVMSLLLLYVPAKLLVTVNIC